MQHDFILNEARKFALLLAKLMGFKAESEYSEYLKQFNNALHNEYDAKLEELLSLNEEGFVEMLNQANYSAEKLNAQSQLLYLFAEPFEANAHTAAILKKVMVIFDMLEKQHHFESFENLNKRNAVYKFFNTYYERS